MDRILKPDRICVIREPFRPNMPSIPENQTSKSETLFSGDYKNSAQRPDKGMSKPPGDLGNGLAVSKSSQGEAVSLCQIATPIKVVVFDFDCTLTSYHVYGSLAGTYAGHAQGLTIPAPFASTESGQLEKLKELRIALGSGPQSFVTQAFGGNERLLQLHYMLTELTTKRDLQCIICSRGYVGIIQNLLGQAQLGFFFLPHIGQHRR